MMVPIMAATMLATATARWIDGYSIYSARLPFNGFPGSSAVDDLSGLR
jgi:H+/Cl- antiporter ClcA